MFTQDVGAMLTMKRNPETDSPSMACVSVSNEVRISSVYTGVSVVIIGISLTVMLPGNEASPRLVMKNLSASFASSMDGSPEGFAVERAKLSCLMTNDPDRLMAAARILLPDASNLS